jgi:4-hydroxyphenylpyruvate dioxygenase
MDTTKLSFIDHRAAGWYYPWIMGGSVPTSSPLEKKMHLTKQGGFDGMGTSWWDLVSFYQERGDLSQLKAISAELGLPLTGYTFTVDNWAFSTGKARENAMLFGRTAIGLAHAVGCDNAAIVGPLEKGDLRHVASAYRELCQYAATLGMKLAFELMGLATQLNSIRAAREMLELAAVENGGLAIDSYHFFAGPSTWRDLEDLPLSQIIAVHLADGPEDLSDPSIEFNRIMPGEGELELVDFVRVLDAKGFDGFWHVECIRGADYATDLAAVIKHAFERTTELVTSGLRPATESAAQNS